MNLMMNAYVHSDMKFLIPTHYLGTTSALSVICGGSILPDYQQLGKHVTPCGGVYCLVYVAGHSLALAGRPIEV